MARHRIEPLIDQLRRIVRPPEHARLVEGQLLSQFVACRDQGAFAALVRLHGPIGLNGESHGAAMLGTDSRGRQVFEPDLAIAYSEGPKLRAVVTTSREILLGAVVFDPVQEKAH